MSRPAPDAAPPGGVPGPGGRVRVRGMHTDDLAAVLAIERASFATPWSERTFRGLLRRSNARLAVVEDEGGILGYAVAWFAGGQAELGDLAVRPESRRRGVGRLLLEAMLAAAAQEGIEVMFLEVRESNLAARALYEEAGFVEVDRRLRYYADPTEDALVLRRPIAR